jgi:ParB family transcriptional regulator, chromosome partitioning protein
MTTTVQSEYRNLPLDSLTESSMNPRRSFDDVALTELANSIRSQGVLSPLLVRSRGPQSYEIVAGARRYRAAQLAGQESVPVRIVELSDAQAIETSIVENLQRRDVHPLEEAQGFAALLRLEEPKYSIEQIAAKCAKSASFVAARLKLTELAPAVTDAFLKDEIGTGHALLLAKLQPAQQEDALTACFREDYVSGGKPRRILLPVRQLQEWIERHILLELDAAPFPKDDPELVPEAGACLTCPKRTGFNALLFAEIKADACTSPDCYQSKVDAFVAKTIVAKPKLVQITRAYGKPQENSPAIPRNQYVEIIAEKPTSPKQAEWPEYKTCKFTTEAIVTEGSDKGEVRRICANADCPVHHPKKAKVSANDGAFKAVQEKQRREEAIAQSTGLRVLSAIVEAVPVRLMKRDLLFVLERLAAMLDERRVAIALRLHGIGKGKTATDTPAKLLATFARKAEESVLGRLLVEIVILFGAQGVKDAGKLLREAAEVYKVDVSEITAKVKQEFAAKERARANRPASPKSPAKAAKKRKTA